MSSKMLFLIYMFYLQLITLHYSTLLQMIKPYFLECTLRFRVIFMYIQPLASLFSQIIYSCTCTCLKLCVQLHSINKLLIFIFIIPVYCVDNEAALKTQNYVSEPKRASYLYHFINIFYRNSEKFTSDFTLRLQAWSLHNYNMR